MKITINKKKYEMKYTIRAMFLFEQINNKMFEIRTMMDEYLFFYCLLLANNKDMEMDFNSFLDAIDNDPRIMQQYRKFMEDVSKKQKLFNSDDEEKDDGKKKE